MSSFLVSIVRRALVAYVICDLLPRLGLDPGVTPIQIFGLFIIAGITAHEFIPNFKLAEDLEKQEALGRDTNALLHVTRFIGVLLLWALVRFSIWVMR